MKFEKNEIKLLSQYIEYQLDDEQEEAAIDFTQPLKSENVGLRKSCNRN